MVSPINSGNVQPAQGVNTSSAPKTNEKKNLSDEQKLNLFDKDQNGVIEGSEQDYMDKILNAVDEDIEKFDSDGSGSLKKTESKNWLNKWLVTISSRYTVEGRVGDHVNSDEMYDKYDTNKDGELDSYELAQMYIAQDADGSGALSDEEANGFISEQQNNVLRENGQFKAGFGDLTVSKKPV